MKSFMIFLLSVGFVAVSMAQTACKGFFAFEKNGLIEYTTYDKKGEVQLLSSHKITKVESTADGTVEATVETVTTDEKGNKPMEGQFVVRCKDNVLVMDVTSMLGPQATSAFANLEISVTGDDLQLPSSLSVGQELPDASSKIKAGSGGVSLITMTVNILNRKVVAKETVQTAAGSFECYKINYTTETKTLGTRSIETSTWYAEGVGMVRQESYDKKGKLESKMELTKFEKGK